MFAYQSGFGNEFATEALAGALPLAQNSPQRCPYGLYAEQFSGTAFTAPRHANRRSWLYRIRPAATHAPFRPLDRDPFADQQIPESPSPNQLRWDPPPLPTVPTDFIEGLLPIAGNGSPQTQTGCGIYLYVANRSMGDRFFYSADGELLIVPQHGALTLDTELGRICIEPQEIAVVPRGLRFRVDAPASGARGYICENFGSPFKLPDLGPIGSNGLANPREATMPLTSTICVDSMQLARYRTIIRTLRYSRCCIRPATPREPAISISWSFRPAGWRCKTPFGRLGSIAMSRVNSWA